MSGDEITPEEARAIASKILGGGLDHIEDAVEVAMREGMARAVADEQHRQELEAERLRLEAQAAQALTEWNRRGDD